MTSDQGVPNEQRPAAQNSELKALPGVAAFLGMGTTVAACVAAGVVLGILGDDHLHTAPWMLIVGLVLGLVAATATVVAQVRRYL